MTLRFVRRSISALLSQRELFLLILIIALGGFLRLFHLRDYLHFALDEAVHAQKAVDVFQKGWLPLVGPREVDRAGFEGFLGPAYYYLLALPLLLSGYHPIGGAIFVVSLGLGSIVLLYLIGNRLFGAPSGIFAAFIYAVGWPLVEHNRFAWNPNVLPFFILSSLWLLLLMKDGRVRFPLFIASLAISLQLHASAFLLLPFFVLVWFLLRPKVPWGDVLLGFLVALALFSPILLFEWRTNFSNTQAYLYTFTHPGPFTLSDQWQHVSILLGRLTAGSLIGKDEWQIGVPLATLGFGYLLYRILIDDTKPQEHRGPSEVGNWILISWFGTFLLGLLTYKYELFFHHLTIIYPAIALLFGELLGHVWQWVPLLGGALALVILTANIATFGAFLESKEHPPPAFGGSSSMRFMDMEAVTNFIANDAQDHPFEVKYVSPDIPGFRNREAYEYLLRLHGKFPLDWQDPRRERIYVVLQPASMQLPEDAASFGEILSRKEFGQLGLVVIQRSP